MEIIKNDIAKAKAVTCRICKSSETRLSLSDIPIWINDVDKDKNFTGEYLCFGCHFIPEKCIICNRKKIEVIEQIGKNYFKQKLRMYKIYDEKGHWTGEYICKECNSQI